MTREELMAAGTKAGRDHAIAAGRPPAPWTREDSESANVEIHRLARLHKIDLYRLPGGKDQA